LDATYNFTFTGKEEGMATVVIRDKTLEVQDGHLGVADIHITADSHTWLGFLAKERNIVWALLRRKIRIQGPVRLLKAFGRCFPS
ncbi:MAG: SCP2 sterol-binding domain-containing protein, partial [Acidobacteriota bacterium]